MTKFLPDDWIEAARDSDSAAREALSEWCLRRAYRIAFLDLGDVPNRESLADEIASTAALNVIERLDKYTPGTRFEPWLNRIVRNCLFDAYRARDQAVPSETYRRWIHDFVETYGEELQEIVRRELSGSGGSSATDWFERIVADLHGMTYHRFLRHTYEGAANAALTLVKRRLRAFVGIEWTSLYEMDDEGEWVETPIEAPEEPESLLLHRELIERVNQIMGEIDLPCRRYLRWHYYDDIGVPEIARIEGISTRTAYRRLDTCQSRFRAKLCGGGYFE